MKIYFQKLKDLFFNSSVIVNQKYATSYFSFIQHVEYKSDKKTKEIQKILVYLSSCIIIHIKGYMEKGAYKY